MEKGRQKTERDGKGYIYIREIRREIRLFSHHFGVASCPCSLFSSTEPGKKIASRPRERNIVLMSPGMLRYPLLRVPNVPPFPSPPSCAQTSVMPLTFNPVFVSLRFRVFLCHPLSFSSPDDSPPLIPDDNIQFTSRLLSERDTCRRLYRRREEIFALPILINKFMRFTLFESIRNNTEHDFISVTSRCESIICTCFHDNNL